MTDLLTQSNLMFAVWFLTIIFGVYLYFRTPQEDIEKKQAKDDGEIRNKADVLAQQLQWAKETTDKRFEELGHRIADTTTLAQNHIHTVDVKVDLLTAEFSKMSLEMSTKLATLTTIIDERIPKKML